LLDWFINLIVDKMDRLISMTDFVISMREDKEKDNIRKFWACERYANFLKQPLTLGMFVPCDLDGNVLEESKCDCYTEYDREGCSENCSGYVNAKNRCLFEGKFDVRSEGNPFVRLNNIEFHLHGLTIERLVTFDLQLTQTALKQLGL